MVTLCSSSSSPGFLLPPFLGEKNATASLTPDSYYFALQAGCFESFFSARSHLTMQIAGKAIFMDFFFFLIIINRLQCVKLIPSGGIR